MKRIIILLCGAMALTPVVSARTNVSFKAKALKKWHVPSGNYSGITPLGEDRYAVVSDKAPSDGFFVWQVKQDAVTGKVLSVRNEGFMGNPHTRFPQLNAKDGNCRSDMEAITFCAPSGTLFLADEGSQSIWEYSLQAQPTGRMLKVPTYFQTSSIQPNYGFESITYDAVRHSFWTTTESHVRMDNSGCLRIQCFNEQLTPCEFYAYRMDTSAFEGKRGLHVRGVSELLADADGSLLVLEREALITPGKIGSQCIHRLYRIQPNEAQQLKGVASLNEVPEAKFLSKQLVCEENTRLNLTRRYFANYEGMCWGRTLTDGRRTLLLVSDSQNGYGNMLYHLKDYVKVLVLPALAPSKES